MLSLWPYSKMNDHRVYWGDQYIFLTQDPLTQPPFKLGMSNEQGWAAYANHGHLFVKRFDPVADALYPDFSASSYETYTTDYMMEMESLSPLAKLSPENSLTHTERWYLYADTKIPQTEADVRQYVVPKIQLSK